MPDIDVHQVMMKTSTGKGGPTAQGAAPWDLGEFDLFRQNRRSVSGLPKAPLDKPKTKGRSALTSP